MFCIERMGQYMFQLRKIYWVVVKHVLCYLKCEVHYGLRYVVGDELMMYDFVDSDSVGVAMGERVLWGSC